MFQNIVKDGSQARKVLDLTANSTEELAILAERELSRVEDSVSFKFQKQIEKLQAALAPIGGEFIKAVTPIIEGATKILKWFNGLGDGAKQFAVIAVAAVGVIAPTFLMLFGLVANGFANFIKGISKVGSFLGVLSGQSKLVGGSINYMTQEQLEAQAVSASLNQTHQTLYQTFTSEAAAVDSLAGAYARAVTQMSRMNTATAGSAAAAGAGAATAAGGTGRYNPFMPPKKYNKGVVMVPGPKGKGDIVPAMLTPGESVIPAEETRKYLPLIKGIISDSLPGFALGEIVGGPGNYRQYSRSAMMGPQTATEPMNMQWLASSPAAPVSAASAIKLDISRQSGTPYEQTVSPEGQQAVNQAGQILQKHAQNTADFSTAAKQAYQEWLESLNQAVQAGRMTAQEAETLKNSGRALLDPTQEDLTEFSAPRQGLEERGGQLVAGKSRSERVGESNRKAARQAFRKELQLAGMDPDIATEPVAVGDKTYKKMEFAHTQPSMPLSEAEAKALGVDTAPRTRISSQQLPEEMELLKRKAQGQKTSRGETLLPQQDAVDDGTVYAENLDQTIESTGQDPYTSVRDRGSPHSLAGPDGADDAAAYTDSFENQLRSDPLSPPPPPRPPGMAEVPQGPASAGQNLWGKFKSGTKKAAERGLDKFAQTAPGQRMAQSFADASGNRLVDSQGNVVATPTEIPQAPPTPAQIDRSQFMDSLRQRNQGLVDQGLATFDELTGKMTATAEGIKSGLLPEFSVLDENIASLGDTSRDTAADVQANTEAVRQNGDASGQAGLVPHPDGSGRQIPQKQADRIIRREDRRQKRQARAGKALMGLGAVTGGLAAATQINVEVPGIGNVAEFAQRLLPVTGALTAIAPILLSLPLPIAALVAVIGTGVYLWMRHNKQLKEAREEAYKFTKALGTGEKEMNKFAEFAGNVSSQELLSRRIQNIGRPLQKAPGETTFGEAFSASEIGEEYISTVREAVSSVGSAQAGQMLFSQLSSAIVSNVLTIDQARSIATAVGEAIGDYGISLDVQSQLLSLIGPNGEDVLKDPLQLSAIVTEVTESSGTNAMAALEAMQKPLDPLDPKVLNRFIETRTEVDARRMFGDLDVGGNFGLKGKLTGQDILGNRTFKDISDLSEEDRAFIKEQYGVSPEIMQKALVDPMSDAGQEFFTSAYAKLMENDPESIGEMVMGGLRAEAAIMNQENIGKGIAQLENFYATVQSGLAAVVVGADDILNSAKEGLVEARESGDAEAIAEAEEAVRKAEQDRDLALANLREENRVLRQEANRGLLDIDVSKRDLAFEDQKVEITSNLEGQELRDMENVLGLLSSTADEDYETNVILRGMLRDGDIEALTLSNMITGLDDESANIFKDVVADMSFDVGEDYAAKFAELLTAIENPEIVGEILLSADGTIRTPTQTIDYINSLGSLISLGSVYGEVGSESRQFFEEDVLGDPLMSSRYEQNKARVESLGGDYSEAALQEEFGDAEGAEIYAALEVDREKWDTLNEEARAGLVTDLTVGVSLSGEQPVIDFIKASFAGTDIAGEDEVVNTREEIIAGIGQRNYDFRTGSDIPAPGSETETTPTTDGGSGSAEEQGSFLDEIVEKYRNFSDASQELTTGFDESLAAIMEFAKGGAWGLNGLARQLRNVNVSENLIQKFLGMDPEEWEKVKPKLFQIDEESGEITGLTEEGEAVQQAEASATIAEETDNIDAQTESVQDQLDAYDKLVAQGADTQLAYEMIQNEALATAIANSKSAAEVRNLIKAQKELKELQGELEEIDEEEKRKERIREAIQKMNEEFEDQVKALDKVRAATDKYTDAQIKAIFGNKDLRSLFLEPNIDKAALEKALQNAEKQAQLELDIKLLTFEGREDYLSEAFKKAKEKLSAEEGRIELAFDLEVAGQEKIIQDAQNEINSLTYMIDDYQAQLDEIQYREDEINEKYDKRSEALDKIANINDRIAAQQKNQLDLAEALSRGDIAAAAQAAQTAREQESKDNLEAQRELMEQRKQAELESIRGIGGLTREQLEDQIDSLNRRISGIEEQRLEPAEEYIRLAELRRDREIENLEVLGRTSEQWDLIQNNLDVARTRNYEFMNEMREQFALYPQILQKYLEGEPLPPPPALPKPPPPPRKSRGRPSKWEGGIIRINGKRYSRDNPPGRGGTGDWRSQTGGEDPPSRRAMGGLVARMAMGGYVKGGMFKNMAVGGTVPYRGKGGSSTRMSMGGVVPSYMAMGGKPLGSDLVPAMLTPGEFVVRRPAVSSYGVDKLENINRGTHSDGSVYNYNLAVNVKSDSNPEQIANTVMREIKRIDSQRIRNNRY